MTWIAPPLPHMNSNAKIEYWLRILEVPQDEPGAGLLREMAAQRLLELQAISEIEAGQYITESGPTLGR